MIPNSIQTMLQGGTLDVSSKVGIGNRRIPIEAANAGRGMHEGQPDRIFDLWFYTNKPQDIRPRPVFLIAAGILMG